MIEQNQYKIAGNSEEEPDYLIQVHCFIQLGIYLIQDNICKKADFLKFVRSSVQNKKYFTHIREEINRQTSNKA